MKAKPKKHAANPKEGLAAFEQLPEKTRQLMHLKEQSARATGETSVRIQKKIRKRAKKVSPSTR
jgi:hypothetical protein